MLQIVEILGRSTQGVTRPFLCRCEDDALYYVKGASAGKRSLICEWMAGHLAIALGIRIPQFAIASADQALLDLDAEGRDLGAGYAFASRVVSNLNEITFSSIGSVPPNVRRDVLIFDWWVRNGDRSLTERGGNPNLFWEAATNGLVTLDHNQAFDTDFNPESFSKTHVFRADLTAVFGDLAEMAGYASRLTTCLEEWDKAWSGLPEEWKHHDDELTVPTDFDADGCRRMLQRCSDEDFWRLA
ncbi:HipA family kinase [Stenotrophomonas sp.]|uniref:HipA family kinase n=1 Tax=Stenotrophomonas sp. TaxID=69392 RepID=UPI0028A0DBE9|nr:HipA family kinase [Stenotrophomonas sp.]